MSKTIGKILGILLSISIFISGICMIMQCLAIYNSGDKPYSRQAVALAFGEISLPVFICLALVIITFIYNFVVDGIYARGTVIKNNSYTIKAIARNKDVYNIDDPTLKKERRTRMIYSTIQVVLIIIGFTFFFFYALNPSNFHQSEINASMIKAMAVFGSCILIPFVYSIISAFVINKSREREIKKIRELAKDAPAKSTTDNISNKNVYIFIKIAALLVAAGIIVYGLCSGGTADVLTKAINICTECIGLG